MVTITLVVGTLAAGYRCGRQLRQNGIVNGALTGGMMYLVLLAISLTVPRNEVGLLALYKCLLMLGGRRHRVHPCSKPPQQSKDEPPQAAITKCGG